MISVIMAAYNAEKYIQQSIESVINQTYKDWELIIVNDGSIDDTRLIAESYSQVDKRIIVFNQENKQLGAARNTGMRQASGEWIAFLDSDDLWEPFKLEKQINFSYAHPNVDVIYSGGMIFSYDDMSLTKPYATKTGFYDGPQMYKLEYFGNFIPILSVIVKKYIVDGLNQQEDWGCEDWDYWLRLAKRGANFFGMEDNLFYYRRHDSNMSSSLTRMGLAELSVLVKNFDPKLLDKKLFVKICKQRIKNFVINLNENQQKNELRKLLLEINKYVNDLYLTVLYKLLGLHSSKIWLLRCINKIDTAILLLSSNEINKENIV